MRLISIYIAGRRNGTQSKYFLCVNLKFKNPPCPPGCFENKPTSHLMRGNFPLTYNSNVQRSTSAGEDLKMQMVGI